MELNDEIVNLCKSFKLSTVAQEYHTIASTAAKESWQYVQFLHELLKLDFGDKIYVHLKSSDILTIPYNYTSKIKNATKEQLQNYRLIGGGIGVHFEDIDEDISIGGIIDYKIKHELRAS